METAARHFHIPSDALTTTDRQVKDNSLSGRVYGISTYRQLTVLDKAITWKPDQLKKSLAVQDGEKIFEKRGGFNLPEASSQYSLHLPDDDWHLNL